MRTPPLVLIADDNPMNLKILATRLVAEGSQIVTAPDGAEALAARAAQRPDLILLDVMMPKIDGVEVCRRLKEDPTAAFTPIILDAGADEYLTKPVSHQAFIARVRSMLRIKGLHDTSTPRPRRSRSRACANRCRRATCCGCDPPRTPPESRC